MLKEIEIDINNFFKENSDEIFKNFHSNLCPNIDNIIGIKVPILKKYSKQLLSKYLTSYNLIEDYIKNGSEQYNENLMLKALVIAYSKLSIEERENLLDEFVFKINNWSVCDILCSNLKLKTDEKVQFYNYIDKFSNSDKEFEIRFYIVTLISNYIDIKYISNNFNKLESVKNDKYYVKMAIAWYISICYIKYKEETLKYLKNCNLDNFTYNKALQKIIESLRVSKEEKEYIKKLKRK